MNEAVKAIQKRYGGNAVLVASGPASLEYRIPPWRKARNAVLVDLTRLDVHAHIEEDGVQWHLVVARPVEEKP